MLAISSVPSIQYQFPMCVLQRRVEYWELAILSYWQHFHIDNIFIRNIPTALRNSAPLRLCVKKETAQLPNLGLIIYRLLIRASDRLLCILTFKSGHKRVTDCLISLFLSLILAQKSGFCMSASTRRAKNRICRH